MDRERYLHEIESQYHLVCVGLKNGKDLSALERGRFEGFIRAGLLLGVIDNRELQQLLEDIHFQVFGKSIAERKRTRKSLTPEEPMDYGQFDSPAIGRVSRR